MRIAYCTLLLFAAASSNCAAESFEALGQKIEFTNPSGYCSFKNSAGERELLAKKERLIGPSGRLVHAAARCSELIDVRQGRTERVRHWLLIQLIPQDGVFKRLEISRQAFLDGLSSAAAPRLDPAELNERLAAASETQRVRDSEYQRVGRDGNAVYASIRLTIINDGERQTGTGLQAVTLLNALPITINVYESTGLAGSRDQLRPVLQSLLASLLAEN